MFRRISFIFFANSQMAMPERRINKICCASCMAINYIANLRLLCEALKSIFVNSLIYMATDKNYILTKETASKKLRRIAYEIVENNMEEKELILAGIRESGSIVAKNIQKELSAISQIKTTLITLTLDKREPNEVLISKTFDFNDK